MGMALFLQFCILSVYDLIFIVLGNRARSSQVSSSIYSRSSDEARGNRGLEVQKKRTIVGTML